jgi:CRP-like cAMP-binding protein
MYKAIVQVAGSGFALDVETARQVARDNEEFWSTIVQHEQLILAQAQQSAACNAVHNLEQRLARWLLRVRDATASDRFDLTQESIAEMLGVRRTSVSLVANALQKAGLISYRRGHISVDNLEGLRSRTCECYQAIKDRYDSVLRKRNSTVPAR